MRRRPIRAGRPSGLRTRTPATGSPGWAGFVLYFGKLMRQKGVHLLLDAWSRLAVAFPDVALVVVGFGDARAELEAMAGERVIFTGAMDHDHLHRLVPLADAVVVPSVLPEAFGMVAAEAASCGVLPIVANHSGLAEVAAGLGSRTASRSTAPPRIWRRGSPSCSRFRTPAGGRWAWQPARPSSSAGAGRGSHAA